MANIDIVPQRYGSSGATSTGYGFSTAISYAAYPNNFTYDPVEDNILTFPTWGPAPSDPNTGWWAIGLDYAGSGLESISVRGLSDFVVVTSGSTVAPMPAGVQVGDTIIYVLVGRSPTFTGGTDQWTTSETWTWETGTSASDTVPVYTVVLGTIYRSEYSGSAPTISTTDFTGGDRVWAIQTIAIHSEPSGNISNYGGHYPDTNPGASYSDTAANASSFTLQLAISLDYVCLDPTIITGMTSNKNMYMVAKPRFGG